MKRMKIFLCRVMLLGWASRFGVELSHWNTRYKGSGDADDRCPQTSFLCKF